MPTPPSPVTPLDPVPSFDTARIDAQLRRWQERLLDLTKGNPLLGLNRSRVSKLQVSQPSASALLDHVVVEQDKLKMPLVRKKPKEPSTPTLEGETPEEVEYVVEPGDVTFDAAPQDLLRRLRRIADNARTTVQERGVTTLHLALGMLRWEEPALGRSVSPLWLVPCQFEYTGPTSALRLLQSDEEMQLNPALELYLRERHHVSLPSVPEAVSAGDLPRYLGQVRSVIADKGWTVSEEAWLSTFTFESLVIYQDLKVMADVARANSTVAALARAGVAQEGSEALGEEELDVLPSPDQVPVPVLPADASQLRALALATARHNIVVHGPPGTGKSQTISNLIADALGRGQTVLFVSAKMAALDVVHDRINREGLGRFCLEAHSTKAGKAKIVAELKRTLETQGDGDGGLLAEQLDELRQVRSQLNDYVVQLHQPRDPLGLSVYQAIGKVAKLADTPELPGPPPLPWEDPLVVTRGDLRAALDLLGELSVQSDVFDGRGGHPWRGLATGDGAEVREESLTATLAGLQAFTDNLLAPLQILAPAFGPEAAHLCIESLRTLEPAFIELSRRDRLPQGWRTLPADQLEANAELLATAATHAARRQEAMTEYERGVAVSPKECEELLRPLKTEFRSWTRVFSSRYWQWRRSVQAGLAPGAPVGIGPLRSYLALAGELISLEAWFESQQQTLGNLLESAELRSHLALAKASTEFHTAALLQAVLGVSGSDASGGESITAEVCLAAKSLAVNIGDTAAGQALQDVSTAWPNGFVGMLGPAAAPVAAVRERCAEALGARARLREWLLLSDVLRRAKTFGLGPFIDALGEVSARLAPAAFERRFHTLWTQRAIEQSPAIRLFSSERRSERTDRFRQVAAQIRKSIVGRIKSVASTPARDIAGARTNLGDYGEVGILRRELQKTGRQRIKPLRKLFAEIPHALQALKPCMLMSPLSVSTFLKPGAVTFDLVVFDEASQLPTPEAIPSILRARQVVVAGDEKQLPPTTFFDAATILDEEEAEEDSAEELEPLESLLDDCVAINPVFLPTYLKWHYRSRDERLISFSNHYFYDNGLITFPSATTATEGRGVHRVFVPDGVWDRGRSRTNRPEAQRVAALIVEQCDRFPDRSLGVVAMNTTQREAIEVALHELLENRPDLAPLLSEVRDEPFFIKSLENVQGDQRDAMIISVGYAKTAAGALSLNFGPLNREGGWRRLNVLITRAKWQTILVTSMRSQDLAAVSANNRGAFMLRKFIEYAEQGGILPKDSASATEAETNDFEEAVAEALRQRDLVVDEQVGVGSYRIDLAIRDPRDHSRYLLGVECDGASFHSAKTARDRDLLRQDVLRDQGWRLYRLWSTNWFHDREKAIQGVLRSVEQAMLLPANQVEAPPEPAPPPAPPPPAPRHEPVVTASKPSPGRPYRKYQPSSPCKSSGITNPKKVTALAWRIAEIVRCEGPIHEEVLMDRLKEIHGVARAGSNIQENVKRAIAFAVNRYRLCHDAPRQMFSQDGAPITEFRTCGDGVVRTITQVPTEEIGLAVRFVIEDQFGFQRDRLPRAVAEVLKVAGNGGVAETVGSVVDEMIECGSLRLSGPNVYLA